jgi:hypothetical protein
MTHLLAFALCLLGFAALAFAMRRHQREIFGRPLQPAMTWGLRSIGACALLFALGLLVARQGWSLALVMFSGHTSMAAALVLCVLIAYARNFTRHMPHR